MPCQPDLSGVFRVHPIVIGLSVTLLALAETPIPAFAGQSGSDTGSSTSPHKKPSLHDEKRRGDQTREGCPSPESLADYLVANNLQAHFSNSGNTSTYGFGSSVTGVGPVGGVPGLIRYCVYPVPSMQAGTTVAATGANGASWISSVGPGYFSFARPDGDQSNIPLDGSSTVMGTATWNALPSDQRILLQIKDAEVCADLYGKNGADKDKHHKNRCEDGGKDPKEKDGKGASGKDTGNMSAKNDKESTIRHNKDTSKKHNKENPGKHEFDMADTCFVKPVQAPVCNDGDDTLAYNAMPFGVVNCENPSIGYEATQTNEFGDEVQLAGTARELVSLHVVFPSFACSESGHWNTGDCVTTPGATFTHPITANIYAVDNTSGTPAPGQLLATVTQTFTIPYRPSASGDATLCPAANNNPAGARWFNPLAGVCQNQISTVLTFPFPAGITLPDQVIWTVAYNTTHYGYNPIGEGAACYATAPGCPYDSLNVGAMTHVGAPYAGTDVNVDEVFWSTGGPSQLLQLSTGWTGNMPEGAITTQ